MDVCSKRMWRSHQVILERGYLTLCKIWLTLDTREVGGGKDHLGSCRSVYSQLEMTTDGNAGLQLLR